MGVYAGVESNWASQTNVGRTHIATKGIVQSGLVVNLDAGVSSSYSGIGTNWTDLSTSANNSTLGNGPTYDSANGGSLVFDGTIKQATIPDNSSLDFSTAMTLCVWVNRTGNALQTDEVLIHKESGLSPSGGYQLWVSRTTLKSQLRIRNSSNGNDTLVGTSTITSSNWFHISCTYNNPTITLYQNGVNNGSKTSTVTSMGNVSNQFSIGASIVGVASGYAWNGKIAQVLAYNRELTEAEIQQNFNATRSRFGV